MIYLDNASTTKVSEESIEAIAKNLRAYWSNPSSLHFYGKESAKRLAMSRGKIEMYINAEEDTAVFTSSGSEANSLVILGLQYWFRTIGKTHVITSRYEHKSVLNSFRELENQGFRVDYVNIKPDGTIDFDHLKSLIKTETGFVSIMYVNNELGTVNNIPQISKLCKEKNILFHTDAVQAAGVFSLDVKALGVDFMTVSGHKIGAPPGIGFLYAKNPKLLTNIIYGGGQEFGLRPGTENLAYIEALEKSVKTTVLDVCQNHHKISVLSSAFLIQLAGYASRDKDFEFFVNGDLSSEKMLDENIRQCFDDEDITNKILSIRFPGVDAQTLLMELDGRGVCVSSGSACNSNSVEPSHVLKALGLSDEEANSTIRISFSENNTIDEICTATKIIYESVQFLKNLEVEDFP